MAQHELLMTVAAPLIALGRPFLVALRTLPRQARFSVGRFVRRPSVAGVWRGATAPAAAWGIHALAIWLWHLPALFGAAVRNDAVHAMQHWSFLASGILFWWTVFHPRRRADRGMSVVLLFTTAVHTGVLGALITFARAPWYPHYTGPNAFGLTPLADQQLAGMIMWIPGSVAYLIAALFIIRQWLAESEWEVARGERTGLAVPVR
jgi:putative membrane protein